MMLHTVYANSFGVNQIVAWSTNQSQADALVAAFVAMGFVSFRVSKALNG